MKSDIHGFCQSLLRGTGIETSELDAFLQTCLAQSQDCTLPQADTWTPACKLYPANLTEQTQWLGFLSPTLLLEGIWLARVAQPATAHRVAESHLFELYSHILSLDDPASLGLNRLQAGLMALGLEYRLPDRLSGAHEREEAFIWLMPALQLALLHRPRRFFPELLGYTLAHYTLDMSWWKAIGPPELSAWLNLMGTRQASARALTWQAFTASPEHETGDFRLRFDRGQRLYRWHFESLVKQAGERILHRSTTEDDLLKVIAHKLPYAAGYHTRVKLRERSLDDWMRDTTHDPKQLLDILQDSIYADSVCPMGSRLLRAMQFGGSMFGVFSRQEQLLWQDWMKNPTSSHSTVGAGQPPLSGEKTDVPPLRDRVPGCTTLSQAKNHASTLSQRQARPLYTALLHTETSLAVPPEAHRIIKRVLQRSQWLARLKPQDSFPADYSAENLHRFISQHHRQEIERYRPLTAPPGISRHFCRHALLQLAPAILVDGGWLIGLNHHLYPLETPRRNLLRIYADEIGNGQVDWNHPNVYRRLLDSLELRLPPFDSPDFADDPRFVDAAFDIPVYLLSMGWLAEQYFPELLGLNLAIELSGLGASYMRAIDILRYYGLDTTLLQLHLSIDNPASGHTALAEQALRDFLDNQRQQLGDQAMGMLWQRVINGYHSLEMVSLKLVAVLMMGYLKERLMPKRV